MEVRDEVDVVVVSSPQSSNLDVVSDLDFVSYLQERKDSIRQVGWKLLKLFCIYIRSRTNLNCPL